MELGNGSFNAGAASAGGGADTTQMKQEIEALKSVSGVFSVTFTPTEGMTYSVPASDKSITVVNAEASSDLSAITVNLPQASIGRRLFFHSLKQIEALTFAMPGGLVDNAQVTLSPGDSVDFTYMKPNNWSRSV